MQCTCGLGFLIRFGFVLLFASLGLAQTTLPAMPGRVQTTPIPDEFKDPETGLRVIHLSRFPNDYSGVIYFTYNTFSPDSKLALIDAQFKDKWRYLYTFDFASMTAKPLVTDRLTFGQVVHPKSGNVYYQADNAVWTVPLKGGTPRKIADIPGPWFPGIGLTVNADETLLLSGGLGVDPATVKSRKNDPNGIPPHVLYTVNIASGEVKIIHRDNVSVGHVQFSPTDPDLCMFCWEGNWRVVDRIWLINPSKSKTDAGGQVHSNARIAYHRIEAGEGVGHEFWQPDGKHIWYQHFFAPGSKNKGGFECMDLATGKVTTYDIPRGYGGIHQSWSPDGKFLVSDGGGPKGDTKPGVSKYISILIPPTDGSHRMTGRRLVNMALNDYAVEPNPHISPDNHWIIFTATLHGTAQAYAVEVP